MALDTKWGPLGTPTKLPDPDSDGGVFVNAGFIGSSTRVLSASLRVDRISEKDHIVLRWSGLGTADRSTLKNAYDSYGTAESYLLIPDGQSWNAVLAAPGGWQEQQSYAEGGILPLYDITLTFEEV